MAKTERPEGSKPNMTDEQEQALFAQNLKKYEEAIAAQKAATKKVKDIGKIIKSDHGEHGLLMMKTTIALRSPANEEGEKEKIEAIAKAMRWSGLPIGHQSTLFEDESGKTTEERAFAAGKLAGIRGETASAPVQFASGDAYQEWMKGWHEGQASLMAGIKKGPDAAQASKPDADGFH